MTKNEVANFLKENYHLKKSKMKSVEELREKAELVGYDLIKVGAGNYELEEKYLIKDFTKKVKVIENTEEDGFNVVRGIPLDSLLRDYYYVGESFDLELWCYLVGKNEKEFDLKKFAEIKNINIPEAVDIIDKMTMIGYLKEKEDYIEFYFDRKNSVYAEYEDFWIFKDKDVKRISLYKY